MTAGALLDAVERAAHAAFPDRAESLIAAVERRLWLGRSARTESAEQDEQDVEVDTSSENDACAICGRTDVNWFLAVMGSGGAFERFDHDRAWEVRNDDGNLRLPILLCGACRIAGSESPDHDDAVLADLVRALRASGEGESAVAELERRFSVVDLGRIVAPCLACGDSPPAAGFRGGVCERCWKRARATAR